MCKWSFHRKLHLESEAQAYTISHKVCFGLHFGMGKVKADGVQIALLQS
jgi:hypothetical protein